MSLIKIISVLSNSGVTSDLIPKYSGYQALNNEGHPTHVISSFQHKHSVYYNGKTYFLWMKIDSEANLNMVFSFDHTSKEISESYNTLTTNANAAELHSHGSLFVTSSGTLIVATASRIGIPPYSDSGINISRASVSDITTWTPIASGEIDDDCQYCQITQIASGRIFIWYRQAHERAKIMYSDDDGATWSTPVTFFDFNVGDLSEWMYPYGIHNNGGSEFHLVINRRYYDTYPASSVKFPQRFYLKSLDGNTFTNVNETWSKNIGSSGYITLSELLSNALIENATSMNDIVWNGGGVVGDDGNIYLLSEHEDSDGLNFSFWNGSSWTIRKITPTQGTYVPLQSRVGIKYLSSNNFIVYFLETISGKNQLVSYTTSDNGLNWSFNKQYSSDIFTHSLRADLTDNIQISGKGLLATIKGDGTGSNSEIFIQEI